MSDIKVLNFKKVELVAESKAAAIEKINNEFFHVNGDATQMYNKWLAKQTDAITERDKKAFMLDYLATKGKNCPGVGYIICIDRAVPNTKERPYEFTNVKNDGGKRKRKMTLYWIDRATGHTVCKVQGTKTAAAAALKKLYKSGEYHGTADLEIRYDIVEGNPIVMTAKYKPSDKAKNGTYIGFGLEAN